MESCSDTVARDYLTALQDLSTKEHSTARYQCILTRDREDAPEGATYSDQV